LATVALQGAMKPSAPPTPSEPACHDELERRFEKRLIGMSDRLWKKVLEVGEQLQDVHAELCRLAGETALVSGEVREASERVVDKTELNAQLERLEASVHGLIESRAELPLQKVEQQLRAADLEGLREASTTLNKEFQAANRATGKGLAELRGELAAVEDRLVQLGTQFGASDARLAGVEAKASAWANNLTDHKTALDARVEAMQRRLDEQLAMANEQSQKLWNQQHEANAEEFRKALAGQALQCNDLQLELQRLEDSFCQSLRSEIRRLEDICQQLPQQLAECNDKLGTLDKELDWMRDGGNNACAEALLFPRQFRELQDRVEAVNETLLQRILYATHGLSQRLDSHHDATKHLERSQDEQRLFAEATDCRLEQQVTCVEAMEKSLEHQSSSGDAMKRQLDEQSLLVRALEHRLEKQHSSFAEVAQERWNSQAMSMQATERKLDQQAMSIQAAEAGLEQQALSMQATERRVDQQAGLVQAVEQGLSAQRTVNNGFRAEIEEQQLQMECRDACLRRTTQQQDQALEAKLQDASDHLKAKLIESEQRLLRQVDRTEEGLLSLRELSSQKQAAISTEFRQVNDQYQQLWAEQHVANRSLEQGLAAMQPTLTTSQQRTAACERQLKAMEAWQSVCERQQSTQEQHISRCNSSLQWLAEHCGEIPLRLETKLAEMSAAAREDVSACVLTAFQGEMRLWAQLVQMNGSSGHTNHAIPRPTMGGRLSSDALSAVPVANDAAGQAANYFYPPPGAGVTNW